MDLLVRRIGYSQKGYIDGEICLEWITHFDKYTKDKAAGRPRVLVVDGHQSRFTAALLQYCRMNNIILLCYASHVTHIYQGLDVVCFGPLKKYYSEERAKFEKETGREVTKGDFIQLYAKAHVRALTPENIKAAFRKTGVWPYNPDAISPDVGVGYPGSLWLGLD